ncbi:MAG TPA: class I SAM-dependent methyltransferase [Vicinamibacterales bacterium]|nr:class I SAM-dependent methyltransferase [Vicinamibacterales bacterium]
MSVSSHLAVNPRDYDTRIRKLIPLYDELVPEVARALRHAARPLRRIVDLGVGTGALSQACLKEVPRARVWGIDADAAMMQVARKRLGRRLTRVTLVEGSFLDVSLPTCDAIVASYALHHIRTVRQKKAFYRRCYEALRPGGVLVTGDCAPASTPQGFAHDLNVWFTHLGRTFGGRAGAKTVYESWAEEDVYLPLADELKLLQVAGFQTDVPWRKSPFAVIVGIKYSDA